VLLGRRPARSAAEEPFHEGLARRWLTDASLRGGNSGHHGINMLPAAPPGRLPTPRALNGRTHRQSP
jgi:hypothetical protein